MIRTPEEIAFLVGEREGDPDLYKSVADYLNERYPWGFSDSEAYAVPIIPLPKDLGAVKPQAGSGWLHFSYWRELKKMRHRTEEENSIYFGPLGFDGDYETLIRRVAVMRPCERSMVAAFLRGYHVCVESARLGIPMAVGQAMLDSALFKLHHPGYECEGEPLYEAAHRLYCELHHTKRSTYQELGLRSNNYTAELDDEYARFLDCNNIVYYAHAKGDK